MLDHIFKIKGWRPAMFASVNIPARMYFGQLMNALEHHGIPKAPVARLLGQGDNFTCSTSEEIRSICTVSASQRNRVNELISIIDGYKQSQKEETSLSQEGTV